MLNVKISSRESANIFSVSVYVFRDLFWQICPLFVQVLIKCLKFPGPLLHFPLIAKSYAVNEVEIYIGFTAGLWQGTPFI